ncbi:MAG: imidazoleglycerol-phosphate dehydratase HisB [Actinomycetota bacterium]|nr:imidazoleglycerol-phosphate dehydratase HisB [Actinomycetota bacterium]MDI6821625.1 imidazoleglycerol-phosphate dehydratase HisB [Actinomycetota bacterium]
MERTSTVKRETKETSINISLDIDGKGLSKIDTGIPFLDHMLELFAKHGLFDLTIEARGNLHIDAHHTIEDVGICLGQAFRQCLGDKKGIRRFGFSIVPMDEALVLTSLDISGRSRLFYDVELPMEAIGNFDVSLIHEFFHAFVNHSAITLHIKVLFGKNTHHIIEAIFKSLGTALDMATAIDPRRMEEVPSTKGQL